MAEQKYSTLLGTAYNGKCESILAKDEFRRKTGTFDLIFTSPPFPLNRKKKYGNLNGNEYLAWLESLTPTLVELLADTGSIVIEMGNAWEPGTPTFSTLPLEALLRIKQKGSLHLCQEFIFHNPATLPTPVEWVNKRRIRAKNSFSRFWWMSRTPFPKADNRKVLLQYSEKMRALINKKAYNSGKRPSGHSIGTNSFLIDNGGSIPPNVLISSNTVSTDSYIRYCKQNSFLLHPARMPQDVVEFFIKFLTDENDLVLDPFAGSNTTGYVCETLNRRWISIEANKDYFLGSLGRFSDV